jgi:hypothetical protein
LCRRGGKRTEAEGDWTAQDGCQGGCNAAGVLLSIISCPPTARSREGLLQTSDGSILGRGDDESKAASGGRRRNGKDEVETVWVCQWSRFQRLRTGITWLPVLRAASRVSGPASEKPLPGACASAAHPTVIYSDKLGFLGDDHPGQCFGFQTTTVWYSKLILCSANIPVSRFNVPKNNVQFYMDLLNYRGSSESVPVTGSKAYIRPCTSALGQNSLQVDLMSPGLGRLFVKAHKSPSPRTTETRFQGGSTPKSFRCLMVRSTNFIPTT